MTFFEKLDAYRIEFQTEPAGAHFRSDALIFATDARAAIRELEAFLETAGEAEIDQIQKLERLEDVYPLREGDFQ